MVDLAQDQAGVALDLPLGGNRGVESAVMTFAAAEGEVDV